MDRAPLLEDVAAAPEGGVAYWLVAADGVRLRIGAWRHAGARGTVLLFPGRTEYVEKYGPAAAELRARGYAMLAIDWRGQGLADRLLPDRDIGHVRRFSDYQLDVSAMLAAAQALDLPRPFHLIGHSMGGCIGLRALVRGLAVRSAVFSAPMWGIRIAPLRRPLAWTVSTLSRATGQGHRLTPSTFPESYVSIAPFEGNMLTTDPEMFALMKRQIEAHPALSLGGPSLHWLNEALIEARALRLRASPPYPVLAMLGTEEKVVEPAAVHQRMGRWPGGRLELIPGAEHEVMMERPSVRARFYDAACALFKADG